MQIPEYVLFIGNIGGFLEVFERGHLLVHLRYCKVLSTWSTNPCTTSYRQTEHPTYVTTGQLLVQSLPIPAARLSLRYIMDAAFQNKIEDSSVVSVLLCPNLCSISQIYILLDIFVPLFLISGQASWKIKIKNKQYNKYYSLTESEVNIQKSRPRRKRLLRRLN